MQYIKSGLFLYNAIQTIVVRTSIVVPDLRVHWYVQYPKFLCNQKNCTQFSTTLWPAQQVTKVP